jgi:hypothetical protein
MRFRRGNKNLRRNFTLMLIMFIVMATFKSIPKIQAVGPVVAVTSVYNATQVGTTFLVNITITGVANLLTWAINLTWDPTILKISTGTPDPNAYGAIRSGRYNIYEGPFMKSVRSTIFTANKINNTSGKINSLACGYITSGTTPSGDGVLASINFTYIKVGTATIDIDGPSTTYPRQSMIIDSTNKEIPHEDKDGTVTENDPPIPPIWSELWFQGTIVGIAVVAVVATAFRYRKKIAQHLPKREEEADELVEEDLRFQKSRT